VEEPFEVEMHRKMWNINMQFRQLTRMSGSGAGVVCLAIEVMENDRSVREECVIPLDLHMPRFQANTRFK